MEFRDEGREENPNPKPGGPARRDRRISGCEPHTGLAMWIGFWGGVEVYGGFQKLGVLLKGTSP